MYLPHLKFIIKLQSLWRSFSTRQKVSQLMEYRRAEMRYFIAEDRLETVGKDKYNLNAPRVNKKTYIYKSQAKYTGEWRGNFRDGAG